MEKTRYSLAAALAASSFLAAPSASAQAMDVDDFIEPSAEGQGRVILLEPFAFIKVEDLQFGSYVIPEAGSFTVDIDPIDGTVAQSGDVMELNISEPQRGWLTGAGDAEEAVIITATLPNKMYKNGDNTLASLDVALRLDKTAETDGTYLYQVGTDKLLHVYVGGQITVAAGQESGMYENTFSVTADYQ